MFVTVYFPCGVKVMVVEPWYREGQKAKRNEGYCLYVVAWIRNVLQRLIGKKKKNHNRYSVNDTVWVFLPQLILSGNSERYSELGPLGILNSRKLKIDINHLDYYYIIFLLETLKLQISPSQFLPDPLH